MTRPIRRLWTVVAPSLIAVASCSAVYAADEGCVCPDMAEHQQVLDEAKSLCRFVRQVPVHVRAGYGNDVLLNGTGGWLPDTESDINAMKLSTHSDFYSASCSAQFLELERRYDLAALLYRRMITESRNRKLQSGDAEQYAQALKRAQLADSLNLHVANNFDLAWLTRGLANAFSPSAIIADLILPGTKDALSNLTKASRFEDRCTELIEMVDLQDGLGFDVKSAYMRFVLEKIAPVSAEHAELTELRKRAHRLDQNYQRALACLTMHDQLLEAADETEYWTDLGITQKLINHAIDISDKNLGENHPATVDLHVQLARLYERHGKYQQAIKEYDSSLLKFRRMKDPTIFYPRALESYGDMLARDVHDQKRSDKIYDEARAYYQRTDKADRS